MQADTRHHNLFSCATVPLDYLAVERAFDLDGIFHRGRNEIWDLVRGDVGSMNAFMKDGVLALRDKARLAVAETMAAAPNTSEMAHSVYTWLGGEGSQAWLDACLGLITRHIGVGMATVGLSGLKTKGNLFLLELLRIRCSDFDHYHRLMLIMMKLSSVQDAIIAHASQNYLKMQTIVSLREQTERLRREVAGTVGEANRKSSDLRSRIEGFAGCTRAIVDGNQDIATTSNHIAAAMEEAAVNASQLIIAIEQAKTNVAEAAGVAKAASAGADAAVDSAASLANRAEAINSILSLIREVAGQTNLLALNATIEAARAGDAGRGFAIVAQEVKALAAQTAKATGQIAEQIQSIQVAAREAMAAMVVIREGIANVHTSTDGIRSAMTTHANTAARISHSINETATSAASTSRTVQQIGGATQRAAGQISDIDRAFAEIADQIKMLDGTVRHFVGEVSDQRELAA